jgi:hypothetical protein
LVSKDHIVIEATVDYDRKMATVKCDPEKTTTLAFTAEHKSSDNADSQSSINSDLPSVRPYDVGKDAHGLLPVLL